MHAYRSTGSSKRSISVCRDPAGRSIRTVSPNAFHAVLGKYAVAGDDRQLLFKGLRRQQSIERISMSEREVHKTNDVRQLQIEQGEPNASTVKSANCRRGRRAI